MKKRKALKRILAIALTAMMVLGLVPNMGKAKVVEAMSTTITINASELEDGDGYGGKYWEYSEYEGEMGLWLYDNHYSYVLNVDQATTLPIIETWFYDEDYNYLDGDLGDLTITGSSTLTVTDYISTDDALVFDEANVNSDDTVYGVTSYDSISIIDSAIVIGVNDTEEYPAIDLNGGNLLISNSTVTLDSAADSGIGVWKYKEDVNVVIKNNSTVSVNAEYSGIRCDGVISVSDSKLSVTSGGDALNYENDLTIVGSMVDLNSGGTGIIENEKYMVVNGYEAEPESEPELSGNITITDSSVTIDAVYMGAVAGDTFRISNSKADISGDSIAVASLGEIKISDSEMNVNGQWAGIVTEGGAIDINASNITSTLTGEEIEFNIAALNSINLTDCSIVTPENGKVTKQEDVVSAAVLGDEEGEYTDGEGDEYYYYEITDANGNTPSKIVISAGEEEKEEEKEEKEEEKKEEAPKYKNEWVKGQWYGADGSATYKPKGSWRVNSIGWWYEDESGWFPGNRWQKIDGEWYFFEDTGYMATNQYCGLWDAYTPGAWWVGSDGKWDLSPCAQWRLTGTDWWFGDTSGWYANKGWIKIRGKWYYFGSDGIMKRNVTVDGYKLDGDGVCE